MIHFPILRWGEEYRSLEVEKVVHFATGEPIAEVSQANAGLIARDMRKAKRARDALREIPCKELSTMVGRAGKLFMEAELPAGDGTQTPDDFVRQQSATTGLPEHMCRMNMKKLEYVLGRMDDILTSLTRGLDLDVLTRGWGTERGVPISYQAQTPVLGMVLPSNSPGVHVLWLPVVPMQIGLVLKPGPQEPWTPYRMAQAFFEAGIPRQAIALYPGGADAGAAVVTHSPRTLIFGGTATVEQYKGNPRVQVHGPGFSKILFGDDQVDTWERHLDIMTNSVLVNSGRSCISCSGIWVSRHGREIAEALAERLGPVAPKAPNDPEAALAAFTVLGQAAAINAQIEQALERPGSEDVTAKYRDSAEARLLGEAGLLNRLVEQVPWASEDASVAYLRPTVIYCESPEAPLANTEYMFPFVSVVECPQERMIEAIGPTLVATGITENGQFRRDLLDATNIDRLNLGPVPTIQLNWLQPHEGNIVEFLFRARAFQHEVAR